MEDKELEMKEETMQTNINYKGNIAFYYENSWCHRKKEMNKDGTVKHGRVRGFKTPEEAEDSYYKYLNKFEDERRKFYAPKKNSDIKLKDYLIYWFEEVYSKKAQSTTLMIISYAIYEFIIPNIQYDIKLRLITVNYLEDLLDRIVPFSKSAANKARSTLYLVFKDAVLENYISSNIVINTKKYRNPKKEITILNTEELTKLLDIVSKGNWYLEILLGLFCGLRKGEMMGLKFSDFDLEKQTVFIQRQIATEYKLKKEAFAIEGRKQVERDPKTKNSFRTIIVPKVIIEELMIRKQLIEIQKRQVISFNDQDYVSIQKNGNPSSPSSLNTYLNRVCKNHSLRKITVHGLRHMFATILIENKVSLAKISALLGHASIHTTFDLYCDVMDEKQKIMAFMNNTFASSKEDSDD